MTPIVDQLVAPPVAVYLDYPYGRCSTVLVPVYILTTFGLFANVDLTARPREFRITLPDDIDVAIFKEYLDWAFLYKVPAEEASETIWWSSRKHKQWFELSNYLLHIGYFELIYKTNLDEVPESVINQLPSVALWQQVVRDRFVSNLKYVGNIFNFPEICNKLNPVILKTISQQLDYHQIVSDTLIKIMMIDVMVQTRKHDYLVTDYINVALWTKIPDIDIIANSLTKRHHQSATQIREAIEHSIDTIFVTSDKRFYYFIGSTAVGLIYDLDTFGYYTVVDILLDIRYIGHSHGFGRFKWFDIAGQSVTLLVDDIAIYAKTLKRGRMTTDIMELSLISLIHKYQQNQTTAFA